MGRTPEEHMKRGKYDYWFYKERGICTKCHKEKAVPNRVFCMNCLVKNSERVKERYHTDEKFREKSLKKRRDRYWRLKAKGICYICGKNPAMEGLGTCEACHESRYNLERRKNYAERGLCVWCGGERVKGKRLCAECMEKARKNAVHASAVYSERMKEKREKKDEQNGNS